MIVEGAAGDHWPSVEELELLIMWGYIHQTLAVMLHQTTPTVCMTISTPRRSDYSNTPRGHDRLFKKQRFLVSIAHPGSILAFLPQFPYLVSSKSTNCWCLLLVLEPLWPTINYSPVLLAHVGEGKPPRSQPHRKTRSAMGHSTIFYVPRTGTLQGGNETVIPTSSCFLWLLLIRESPSTSISSLWSSCLLPLFVGELTADRHGWFQPIFFLDLQPKVKHVFYTCWL